jgi:hypothetical protein
MRDSILSFRSLKIAISAVIAVMLLGAPLQHASAQTSPQSTDEAQIIVTPEPISVDPNSYSPLRGPGSMLTTSLQTLQLNLANLAALNTPANQQKLNDLGVNYAHASALGSDLGTAISNINVSQMTDDSNGIGQQVTTLFNGDQFIKSLVGVRSLAGEEKQSVGKNLSESMGSISKLNTNIAELNANIVSLTKTYNNLLDLSTKDPAELAAMPNLAPAIDSVEALAVGDLNSLAGLSSSFTSARHDLSEFQKAGGFSNVSKPDSQANAALGQANLSVTALADQTFGINVALEQTLKPAPASPPAGSPAGGVRGSSGGSGGSGGTTAVPAPHAAACNLLRSRRRRKISCAFPWV